MAAFTLEPTANTNPDQGSTAAVSSASNTGHGSTSTIAAAVAPAEGSDSDDAAKSCRWSSFEAAPAGVTIISLRLQFTYSAVGTVSSSASVGGSAAASASAVIEYTLNGGSDWIEIINESINVSGNDSDSFNAGATADIALSVGQTISDVQVRARYDAAGEATGGPVDGSSGDGSVIATISSIQIAGLTPDASPKPIFLM